MSYVFVYFAEEVKARPGWLIPDRHRLILWHSNRRTSITEWTKIEDGIRRIIVCNQIKSGP